MLKFVTLSLLFFAMSTSSAEQVKVVTELSPPYQIEKNNQVAGTSTRLVKAIFKQANVDAEFSLYPWARAYNYAIKRPNTFIYSMAKTAERAALFHWIGPVADFQLGFVKLAKRKDITITSEADAKPLKIALQRNDLAAEYLQQRDFIIIFTADINDSYQLLLANKVDLIVDDNRFVGEMSAQLGLPRSVFEFAYPLKALSIKGYLAAHINSDPVLIEQLKKAYNKVINSPEFGPAKAFQGF